MESSINGLLVHGDWVDDPILVKKNVKSFFLERFQDGERMRPRLDGVAFKQLIALENQMLVWRFEDVA